LEEAAEEYAEVSTVSQPNEAEESLDDSKDGQQIIMESDGEFEFASLLNTTEKSTDLQLEQEPGYELTNLENMEGTIILFLPTSSPFIINYTNFKIFILQ